MSFFHTNVSCFSVEIASRNELGLHTSWKIAPSNWDSPLKTTPLVKIDGAILTVKQSGLYFIYAQVNIMRPHHFISYLIISLRSLKGNMFLLWVFLAIYD